MLHTADFPKDLKHLSLSELEDLAIEIRKELLEIGHVCGGHLASNLGVVELSLALHTVFDSPVDKFLWDTSHQTYVHKMLTGRLKQMYTIRQDEGLSGFSNIFESIHDSFGAGHASTALSAGLGMAHGRDLSKESHGIVAIIGDASLSGGMAYEALNNSEQLKTNFICVLNDNNMSISKPVGSMAHHITKIRTSPTYGKAKQRFETAIERIPRFGVPLRRRIEKFVDRLRDTLLDVKVGVLFEEFGFKYLGPIDGHNISMVMAALKYAKTWPGPILIHILTTKGKGHTPAEENPIKYHGISPKQMTDLSSQNISPNKTYTRVFSETLVDLAREHQDIVVITPAMKEGSGLNTFEENYPDRFFDVGIAEEHAVTFAAGLSRAGLRPVLAIYSTFLQRGFDQVIHDVCLQKLPVIFCLDRAGLVGEDGPTHQGVFDFAYLLPIPNIAILAPKDGDELSRMLSWAITHTEAVSIRYPKGSIPKEDASHKTLLLLGKAEVMVEHYATEATDKLDLVIIGVGSMVWPSTTAAKQLVAIGFSVAVINVRFVKPLDVDLLTSFLHKTRHMVVVEEGCQIGGVFSHILQECRQSLTLPLHNCHSIGIPDFFIEHGKIEFQKQQLSLTESQLFEAFKSFCVR